MSCETKELEFNQALKSVQIDLENELAKIAQEAEEKSIELEQEFEQESDLANGVAVTAGTVIGGTIGGPAGAVIGGATGKLIGSLFTIETSYSEERISLDIPTITMRSETWKFDVPQVTVKDNDIIFDVPTLVMKRKKGPKIPHSTTRMKTKCTGSGMFRVCLDVPQTTITWEQTYLDVPTYENRKQRIVIGVPEVTMKEQKIVFDIPEIKLEQKDMIFRIPSITIRFAKDAGKKMAEAAGSIASQAEMASAQKRMAIKERIVAEVIEPAKAMFECYKNKLSSNRKRIMDFYDPEINKLTDSLKALKAKGVPENDNDYINQKNQLDSLISKRNESVESIDKALNDLTNSSKKAIEALLNFG
ncbi:hypothetical protein Q4Q39_10355 [Flavivirga amylovorans]|uniref:Uncharacterized protein n=1 Tax=Flavivirga amylovorans TaxID=870486 RepID=A0ABT8X1K7_9FLAO|nr:hypothetical protein [Flavivirga amylovorans]MDO5987801.1 hypothetical protein [Flavivirga amylovorans]